MMGQENRSFPGGRDLRLSRRCEGKALVRVHRIRLQRRLERCCCSRGQVRRDNKWLHMLAIVVAFGKHVLPRDKRQLPIPYLLIIINRSPDIERREAAMRIGEKV